MGKFICLFCKTIQKLPRASGLPTSFSWTGIEEERGEGKLDRFTDKLYNLKLNKTDIDLIIHTVFYHLINSNLYPVTFAWCLGKFYQKDLLVGFTRLFKIYEDEDDVFIQLLMSLNSIYDFRVIIDVICSEFKKINFRNLPKSHEFLVELSEVFPAIKECLV